MIEVSRRPKGCIPVILPPGRASLLIKPRCTASASAPDTIEIVDVNLLIVTTKSTAVAMMTLGFTKGGPPRF